MVTPGDRAAATERASPPTGAGERFAGYGVMGQPFRSGHVLALRRFPHSSIGAGYTSVWHCDPHGSWTMWADAPPLRACARYFGPALASVGECPIGLEWVDPWTIEVRIDGVLEWRTRMARTLATGLLSTVASHLPDRMWSSDAVLAGMSRVAGPMLRAGTLRLGGRVPSDQWFRVSPRYVWATTEVDATLLGESLGEPGPTHPQRWLGDFAVPNRGLFAVGSAVFEPYQPDHHVQVIPGSA